MSDKSIEALLPCPFCGGEPELVGPDVRTRIFIRCKACAARSMIVVASHGGNADEVIAAWNRRAAITAECPRCHGRGYVSGDPEGAPIEGCDGCGGTGLTSPASGSAALAPEQVEINSHALDAATDAIHGSAGIDGRCVTIGKKGNARATAKLAVNAYRSTLTSPASGERDDDLTTLMQKSIAAFAKLSPEEQEAHMKLQRESWVRGEMSIGSDKDEAEARMTYRHKKRRFEAITKEPS